MRKPQNLRKLNSVLLVKVLPRHCVIRLWTIKLPAFSFEKPIIDHLTTSFTPFDVNDGLMKRELLNYTFSVHSSKSLVLEINIQ